MKFGEEPEVISMKIGTRGIDGDDDDTTGISEVKSDDADRGEWYNLQRPACRASW